jgi:hypothetical protein
MILIWRRADPKTGSGVVYDKVLHEGQKYDTGNATVEPGVWPWAALVSQGKNTTDRAWHLVHVADEQAAK